MSKNKEFVKCWCCAYYDVMNEKLIGIPETVAGFCTLSDSIVRTHDEVCPDFLLNSGLHTEKSIPDYCINYIKTAPQK